MIKEIVYIILILFGIPIGMFLALLCGQEVEAWKKSLVVIAIISSVAVLVMLTIDFAYKIPIIISLLFLIVMNLSMIRTKVRKRLKKLKIKK